MNLELKNKHYASIATGIIVILLDLVLLFSFKSGNFGAKHWTFNPIFILGLLIAALPFILDFLKENKRQKEVEAKFLEFVRNTVETVRSGVTIPQAIAQVSRANYGSLTPYVRKLANQITWGYPLHEALNIFAKDTKNPVIKRSVAIVIQAERSGGDMGSVLEAVTQSVLEIKKVKEERKTNAYTQTIQGYMIFFVFIVIMIVLQVYLIPKLGQIGGELSEGIGGAGIGGLGGLTGGTGTPVNLGPIFIATIIVQGLFAGLMIGKFADGNFKAGVKHSLIMVLGGYLIMSTVRGLVGV